MKNHLTTTLLTLIIFTGCNTMIKPNTPKATSETDFTRFNYLTEVTGSKAIDFAKAHNKLSDSKLKTDPRYQQTYNEIFNILSAKDKLPSFYLMNNEIINFWQDDVHIKGVLRKTSVESLNSGQPLWETLLDIDELAKIEQKNWVYKGLHCLEPNNELCLVNLSDGGKDASTLREFNLKTKLFVKNGFYIPESKSHAAWLNENTLLVGDGTNTKTLTASGYPSEIKILNRGEHLNNSKVLFTCKKDSISAYVSSTEFHGNKKYTFVGDQLSFYETELYLVDFNNNKLKKIPIPTSAGFETIFNDQIIFSTRNSYANFKAGSVLSFPLSEIESYKLTVYSLFKPSDVEFFQRLGASKNHIYVHTTKDVKNALTQYSFKNNKWVKENKQIGSQDGNSTLVTLNDNSEHIYYYYFDFLNPTSVYYLNETKKQSKAQLILKTPPRFKSDNLIFSQHKVKSKDGTLIPYFIVHKKGLKLNALNPTLIYAYGGFEIPMTPGYLSSTGKAWLEKGGVYVLANLRGGGEYGPQWHQSVIQENRHKIYEDFYAIVEDLFYKKVTSPRHLGIKGGSNGGLLTSVAFTQHPEYFNAVISEVPLTNMLEYHRWLAGASWMEEYGNPDDPKMRQYLLSYSPLHNLKKEKKYPEVFYLTSTKDDRVHPAHARQMVALMEEMGHPVLYNENTDGGHGRATNMTEMAEFLALEFTYLFQKLFN